MSIVTPRHLDCHVSRVCLWLSAVFRRVAGQSHAVADSMKFDRFAVKAGASQ